MYAGLNLMMKTSEFQLMSNEALAINEAEWSAPLVALKRQLKRLIVEGEVLSAEKIQADWFPQVDAHVFLSHAHVDAAKAKILAAWLYKKFGLKTFIDSDAWGYANDLLKDIDKTFNMNRDGSFSYEKTKISAAHVHMILMSALVKMVDRCECLIFLNTLPPVNLSSGASQSTESPWIYGELMFSSLLKRKSKEAHRSECKLLSERTLAAEQLRVNYPLPQDHLVKLDWNKLQNWSQSLGMSRGAMTLDKLYDIAGVPSGIR